MANAEGAPVDVSIAEEADNTPSPFAREEPNTTQFEATDPVSHTSLEREKNPSKNDEIEQLIEQIRTGQWRADQESKRLTERYGDCRFGFIPRMRQLLGGEKDFEYDDITGTMRHNLGTELARRGLNVLWKSSKTLALSGLIGLATGGVGALTAFGVAGSAIGRISAEALKRGQENRMRERIMIARERYYQKAFELANDIGREMPDGAFKMTDAEIDANTEMSEEEKEAERNKVKMNEAEIAEYQRDRWNKIESLINFVKASEQNAVAFVEDENNLPYIETRRVNELITNRFSEDRTPGEEAMPPTGLAGPTMSTGTEVYQPSDVAPDNVTIDKLDKQFEEFRNTWEKREEGLALAGGLLSGLAGFLQAKAALAGKLADGGIVKMDIDGDGIKHGVQAVNDHVRQTFDVAKNFIFHYNNSAEALAAVGKHATVLPIGESGAHILNENLSSLLNNAAFNQIKDQIIPLVGALLGRYAFRSYTNRNENIYHEEARETMYTREEQMRQRLVPDERAYEVASTAERQEKPTPEVGDYWSFEENGQERKIFIFHKEVKDNDVILHYKTEEKISGNSVFYLRTMSAQKLLRQQNVDRFEPTDEDKKLFKEVVPPLAKKEIKPTHEEKKVEAETPDKNFSINIPETNKYKELKLYNGNVLKINRSQNNNREIVYFEISFDEKGKLVLNGFKYDKKAKKKEDVKDAVFAFTTSKELQNFISDPKYQLAGVDTFNNFEDFEKSSGQQNNQNQGRKKQNN